MEEKFLPIGTVVMLKDATKEVMITSYLTFPGNAQPQKNENGEEVREMYDYGGCPFPEGIINSNVVLVFNHSQIDKVIHMGCKNEAQQNFGRLLSQKADEIKEMYKSGKLTEENNNNNTNGSNNN